MFTLSIRLIPPNKSIDNIIQKGDQLEKLFPDSALFYYQKGLDLYANTSESEETKISKIKILLKIGWIFHKKFKYTFC